MKGTAAGGVEGQLLGAVVTVVGGLVAPVVPPLPPGRTAGAAYLGADGPAQPLRWVRGWPLRVEALQEAEPDRLFQVARLGSGGVRLGRGLGGEQRAQGGNQVVCHNRHDDGRPGQGCPGGRPSPQRGLPLSR